MHSPCIFAEAGQADAACRSTLLSVARLSLGHVTLVVTGKDTGKVLDPFAIKSLIVQTAMEPGGLRR